jgi:hypothetical protein
MRIVSTDPLFRQTMTLVPEMREWLENELNLAPGFNFTATEKHFISRMMAKVEVRNKRQRSHLDHAKDIE